MKKLIYFSVFLLFAISCKFSENPYSYDREFDDGTYITIDGIVKYISGQPDSAVTVSDVYAIIQEEINYINEDVNANFNKDSILIYGHCFSEEPGAFACPPDSTVTLERLKRYSVIHYSPRSASAPQNFISPDELGVGTIYTSTLPLRFLRDYYIKSFVVTGRFDNNGDPVYEHIAYNPVELKITTQLPNDRWVGGTDEEAPLGFPDGEYIGGTTFSYNGYIFVTQGHDAGSFGNQIVIHRYDPSTNLWDNPYKEYTIGENDNFTDGVAFVIENVPISPGIYRDCAYVGCGRKYDGTVNKNFYRLDLEANTSEPLGEWGDWKCVTDDYDAQPPVTQAFNAIAFSINGIGYVGTGQYQNGTPVANMYKYDPSEKGPGHAHGTWQQITDFPGGARSQAMWFQLGDNVYVTGGRDVAGNYHKDVWMCRQTTGDNLAWNSRKEFPGTGRIEGVGFNIGEMGFIGLGLDKDSVRTDFYRYNPFTNSWDQRAYFPGEPRYEAWSIGVKISDNEYRGYVGSGWNGTSYFSDVWYYLP
jgi:N-acetylneuraminic acid mutarotase